MAHILDIHSNNDGKTKRMDENKNENTIYMIPEFLYYRNGSSERDNDEQENRNDLA